MGKPNTDAHVVLPAPPVAEMGPAEFERFVLAHENRVGRYLAAFMRDRSLAEEIAQETFLAAFRDRDRMPRHDRAQAAWILGIAHHRALNVLRGIRRGREAVASLAATRRKPRRAPLADRECGTSSSAPSARRPVGRPAVPRARLHVGRDGGHRRRQRRRGATAAHAGAAASWSEPSRRRTAMPSPTLEERLRLLDGLEPIRRRTTGAVAPPTRARRRDSSACSHSC